MVVSSTNYGTMATHVGTLAEVMGVIGAYHSSDIISIFWDSSTNKVNAICKIMH